MRNYLVFILMFIPGILSAETVMTTSVLEAVKVFPEGAIYDRKVALDLPAGTHQIFVSDLPAGLQVTTLQARVDGMTVRAVEFRTKRQVLTTPQKTDQQYAAEQAFDVARQVMSKIVKERAGIEATIASAELRIKYLKSTAEGKLAGGVTQNSLTAEQLTGVVNALGVQISKAVVELTQARTRLGETDRILAEAHRDVELAKLALDAVTPLVRETGTAVIDLVARNAFQGDLMLTYSNGDAVWWPAYEVTVVQTGAQATIDMVRLASVEQYSGEDWSGIAVTLSTSDLDRSAEVYLPRSDIKYIYKPKQERKVGDIALYSGSLAEPVIEAPLAAPSAYRVKLRGQTLEFELGKVTSLRGDGATKLFRLDTMQSNVGLAARATIGHNETAVLYAELENTTGGTLLPGEVMLIRDGVLVGAASIPEVANGDMFDLALGPLNGILIERQVLEVQDGNAGIISSYSQKIEKYDATVRSLLDYAIDVTLYAALPISESEALVIDLKTTPQPTEVDIEGRRGVVAWTLVLLPQSEQVITYGWRLKWPDEQLLGQR